MFLTTTDHTLIRGLTAARQSRRFKEEKTLFTRQRFSAVASHQWDHCEVGDSSLLQILEPIDPSIIPPTI